MLDVPVTFFLKKCDTLPTNMWHFLRESATGFTSASKAHYRQYPHLKDFVRFAGGGWVITSSVGGGSCKGNAEWYVSVIGTFAAYQTAYCEPECWGMYNSFLRSGFPAYNPSRQSSTHDPRQAI